MPVVTRGVVDLPADQLDAFLADHCALERLRAVRREFLPQLSLLVIVAVLFAAVGVLSLVECLAVLGVLAAAGAWICGLEASRAARLWRQQAIKRS